MIFTRYSMILADPDGTNHPGTHPGIHQDVFVKEKYHFLNVSGLKTPLIAPFNVSAILHVCL